MIWWKLQRLADEARDASKRWEAKGEQKFADKHKCVEGVLRRAECEVHKLLTE